MAILMIGGLSWSLAYVSNKLEARQARRQYWQDQTAQQADKTVTIIEGWNSRQIAEKLANSQLGFSVDDFLKIAGQPKKNYQSLPANQWPEDFSDNYEFLKDKPKQVGLEGYLFADTYRFRPSSSPKEVIIKLLDNFDQQLNTKMRQDIEQQGRTIYQIITMASLLEKEVKTEQDMKIVADIFWRRIKNGQRLESCATLAYILGQNKPQYSFEDTRINSPYNTYINSGLPPGPIGSPSLKAIKAAIYPTPNNYNFFLSRPDNGETIFSRNFEEHKINKAKFLK
ncbi:MAG: endolytic transglycosylase MltG [Synergistaceae bacterium]|nr:endolytic transglycosylase MltG [Synergistaceae bacterium]